MNGKKMWARELTAVRYSIPIRACRTPVRILFFSDLHGASFGEGNRQLLELALAQRADFAALPGDLISRDSSPETVERVCRLLKALAENMPVYLSLGNHEQDYLAHNGLGLLTALAQTGAILLDQSFREITVGGTALRIGGLSRLAWRNLSPEDNTGAYDFLKEYCGTDRLKLLLCHRPESFLPPEAAEAWPVDLILSGHAHGGLIDLPVLGRLYAPKQGLFPRLCYGLHRLGNDRMLITSGFTGSHGVPRLWNPPELVCAELRPEEA